MTPPNNTKKKADSWETQEVITWLTNDEETYLATKNKKAWWIRQYIRDEHAAPEGLYESIEEEPGATWRNVDWNTVAAACKEEEA